MNSAPNLVLVGPMGAGKTSVGRQLAAQLELTFVDADQRLEADAGASVSMLFELEGEAGFRRREEAVLEQLLDNQRQVIATGGGAVLSALNRQRLQRRAFVVYLRTGIDAQLARLARDHTRPLLAKGDRRQTLQALAEARNPLYEEVADLVVDSSDTKLSVVAKRLHAQVVANWRPEQAA